MNTPRSKAFNKIIEKRSEILDEYLSQHLPVNIFLVDTEGYVCWANDYLLRFVGIPLEKAQGLHISNWNHARWEYIYEVIMNKEMIVREEAYGTLHSAFEDPALFDG